mgnify:CR=1 FL=1
MGILRRIRISRPDFLLSASWIVVGIRNPPTIIRNEHIFWIENALKNHFYSAVCGFAGFYGNLCASASFKDVFVCVPGFSLCRVCSRLQVRKLYYPPQNSFLGFVKIIIVKAHREFVGIVFIVGGARFRAKQHEQSRFRQSQSSCSCTKWMRIKMLVK